MVFLKFRVLTAVELDMFVMFRVLTAVELDMFERGDPGSINPELGVDEQADLLPYNR